MRPKEILVCETCGYKDIEVKAWMNANTDEYCSSIDNNGKCWCPQCDEHKYMCSKKIFNKFKK